jgi:CRISPR-associated protein Csh2
MALQNRSEILFLYDVSYSNPNGDPADSNRPRQDPQTERLLVTDVRLKRTVRDYLYEKYFRQKQDAACNLYVYSDQAPSPMTLVERLARLGGNEPKAGEKVKLDAKLSMNDILKECIDARLFGATVAPSSQNTGTKKKPNYAEYEAEGAFHLSGPVQFNMGQSLHSARIEFVKGTGAFATTIGDGQRTFREEFVAAYGLIAFYGCIDHHRAEFTQCSENDVPNCSKACGAALFRSTPVESRTSAALADQGRYEE